MAHAKQPWWIIGSAAVAIHLQKDIGVNDIDVLLTRDDARGIRTHLNIADASLPPHPLFRSSLFFTSHGDHLPIEFMADFALFENGVWAPVICTSRQAVLIGGHPIWVPEVQELAALLKRFGREKDVQRLRLLREGRFSV